DILADSVNGLAIKKFLDAGFTPAFSAITHDGNGQLLNTTADTIAAALSAAMSELYETTLIYCFAKKGGFSDAEDEHSVIETITTAQFDKLKTQGVIYEGMVPKLQNAFDAIHKGVKEVFIGNANNLHLFQQQKFGTRLVNIK